MFNTSPCIELFKMDQYDNSITVIIIYIFLYFLNFFKIFLKNNFVTDHFFTTTKFAFNYVKQNLKKKHNSNSLSSLNF